MGVNAKSLLRQLVLRNVVKVIKCGLTAPAKIEVAVRVSKGPVENLTQFLPVDDVFKRKLLNRRARNNKAVKLLVPNFAEGAIEIQQVLRRCVLWRVRRHGNERHLHLKRS